MVVKVPEPPGCVTRSSYLATSVALVVGSPQRMSAIAAGAGLQVRYLHIRRPTCENDGDGHGQGRATGVIGGLEGRIDGPPAPLADGVQPTAPVAALIVIPRGPETNAQVG